MKSSQDIAIKCSGVTKDYGIGDVKVTGLKRESIKHEKWLVRMCLIISRCFTIESGIILISTE